MSATTTIVSPEVTALRFIERFSHSGPPTASASSPWHPLLDEPSIASLQQEVASHPGLFRDPRRVEEHSNFKYLSSGYHFSVLTHKDHPDCVFKFMPNKTAEEQHRTCEKIHTFATSKDKFWVRIPVSSLVPLPCIPTHSLYVEERLQLGMDMDLHAEFWARIILYHQSEQANEHFHENMRRLVDNISDIVLHFSFWDVGLHNMPEVSLDGHYVCAVDFEEISDEPQPDAIADGMNRLMALFPIPSLQDQLVKKAAGLKGFVSDLRAYHGCLVDLEMKRLSSIYS
ncbi:MAG: hypothetical protein K2P51_06255 [Rhabdochlamydiaceae bacterium]|nr:hypothetical protein [Rhabdochlamydiaceae bacterium]